MKQMNLIPYEVKQKRRNNDYKKIGAIASLLPIGIVAQSYLSISMMNADIQELKDDIVNANKLQQQIETEQKLIEKNRSILINLTSGGLPLNQFLLFTGVHLPEDIRLYSVASQKAYGNEDVVDATEGTSPETEATQVVNAATPTATEPAPTEEVKIDEVKNNIIIKGAALNVDSIGTFMSDLENKNDYIANVDISDVQNFYNGAFNYKLFEIVIELNN